MVIEKISSLEYVEDPDFEGCNYLELEEWEKNKAFSGFAWALFSI